MQANVIVWDLETVSDIGGFAAANDLAGKSDAEIREGADALRRTEDEYCAEGALHYRERPRLFVHGVRRWNAKLKMSSQFLPVPTANPIRLA
jgi:hypothetical protein